MTREEAIKIIDTGKKFAYDDKYVEAFDLAIEALKAEPCKDFVKYINALRKCAKEHKNDKTPTFNIRVSDLCEDTARLLENIKAEPCEENLHREREQAYMQGYEDASKRFRIEPCEDAVKREAVLNTLDTMDKALDENRTVEAYKELLKECYKALPPVTPKQRWIPVSEKLPPENTVVLVCGEKGGINIGNYGTHRTQYQGKWLSFHGWGNTVNPVAWMPLPEPYKAESEDEKKESGKECPRKPCINYEDGCEEWAGCPCVHYKAESENKE